MTKETKKTKKDKKVWGGAESGLKTREDRKGRGAYFTLPESAALLTGLVAGSMLPDCDWGDPEQVRALKVCDPACGAGSLLHGVEEEVLRRQREAGLLIPVYPMLIGMDIDRASLEEAARVLNPEALLYLMPHGVLPDGSVRIGALELLRENPDKEFFATMRDCGAQRITRNG